MSALALADHHGLTGAIEFYDACREANVRPIVGLELAVLPPPEIAAGPGEVPPFVAGEVPPFVGGAGSIVLLAADLAGWRSLCRLSTLAQTAPHRDPERGLALRAVGAAHRRAVVPHRRQTRRAQRAAGAGPTARHVGGAQRSPDGLV